MPQPQFTIEGEELDYRMDVVMANRELLSTASMQIHELLAAMHDLPIKLNQLEIQQVQVAASLAQALIHPTLPEDYFPDVDSMIRRFEWFLGEVGKMASAESILEIMEKIGKSTRQWAVLDMSIATFDQKRSIFKKSKRLRSEMLLPMTLLLCACICEISLWPPSLPE